MANVFWVKVCFVLIVICLFYLWYLNKKEKKDDKEDYNYKQGNMYDDKKHIMLKAVKVDEMNDVYKVVKVKKNLKRKKV